MLRCVLRWCCLCLLGMGLAPSWAQFRVEVSGVGLTQLPVTVAPFRGQEEAGQKMSGIVLADLERSGRFHAVDVTLGAVDENAMPPLGSLRKAGSDAVVVGSVTRLADGKFDVRFRLWDIVQGKDLGGHSYVVPPHRLRLAAHKAADYVYEKLTGDKGVFSTRIAYVTKSGSRYQLWVADADGDNAQSALTSPEPIISPAWSPDGNRLAYVSFEARKPVVYVHDIGTGRRRIVANFKGSNSAPAWSDDGKTLALTLSRDGGSQLFLLHADGGEPRRLLQSSSIDTEPTFAPDGKSIYFVSDRGGAPQIYRTTLTGRNVERVTFVGNYNVSPSISPDGRWMAYVARVGNEFKLHLMELQTKELRAITSTVADENPAFAPNGKMLIYATQIDGMEALMTTTLDGRVKARLSGQSGDIREPDWSPFLEQ
ncbi:Tol-Pal system beta propeller repeat protein TolB [Candidatus Symbiobacter mobilis]|uniref:Tol-Pal system protein TolB n=1 Tax=Candidatus Symbiobacter mobilis CR TaxID=946483 RepID=U5N5K7_9BURK|nr:Tol-Pal system beta propeller repeat protein TolB [Candidatus Symbiobacter mobilis]AGX86545.1 transport protein TolB [Candidatus Symbiobacter mobilis CR]